jgi:hypothetical protein
MATKKRKQIKIGKKDRMIVKKRTQNKKINIDVTLTRPQEINLLKMLRVRHPDVK